MPELPEVQTFVDALSKRYVGSTVDNIIFHRDNLRYPLDKKKLQSIFVHGTRLEKCFRLGKQLVLQTQDGAALISLGMTGAFFEANPDTRAKHEHITLFFQDNKALAYLDPRRFGMWSVYDLNTICRAVDPLNIEALYKFFISTKFCQSQRCIKDVLMDQKYIGGIGNIYALEALFMSKIHPISKCATLTQEQKKALSKSIPMILHKAIALKGSSVKSYKTIDGTVGSFQNHHLIYNRHGQSCVNTSCNAIIVRINHAGRSSWYCPNCQILNFNGDKGRI